MFPLPVIVPAVALQVTAVLLVFETVAVNPCVAPVFSVTAVGDTATLISPGGNVTPTFVPADLVGSAWLVAVTV